MFVEVLSDCLGEAQIPEATLEAFMRAYRHPQHNKQQGGGVVKVCIYFQVV